MSDNTVLRLTNLSKYYDHIKAVDELNLSVKTGEIFGLLGHNGAGKSTTMRMIMSLIKPTSGNIEIFGLDLSKNREKILANIGCIIEKPDFYPWLSAKTNLEMFADFSRKKIDKSQIFKTLDLVGLSDRANDKVKTYSHGMKQRLGLAQAIVHDPEMIILDEPSTGLDPKGIIELRELILHLKNDLHKTVILSSHILSEVELIADSMAIIHKGKTITEGRVADLLSDENMMVRFFISNPVKALEIVKSSEYAESFINLQDNELIMDLNNKKINQVLGLLMGGGIDIHQVISRKRLEDYFLKITASAE
jgi:ABC-type multidrug transport system ATPase subunit